MRLGVQSAVVQGRPSGCARPQSWSFNHSNRPKVDSYSTPDSGPAELLGCFGKCRRIGLHFACWWQTSILRKTGSSWAADIRVGMAAEAFRFANDRDLARVFLSPVCL